MTLSYLMAVWLGSVQSVDGSKPKPLVIEPHPELWAAHIVEHASKVAP